VFVSLPAARDHINVHEMNRFAAPRILRRDGVDVNRAEVFDMFAQPSSNDVDNTLQDSTRRTKTAPRHFDSRAVRYPEHLLREDDAATVVELRRVDQSLRLWRLTLTLRAVGIGSALLFICAVFALRMLDTLRGGADARIERNIADLSFKSRAFLLSTLTSSALIINVCCHRDCGAIDSCYFDKFVFHT
jgi:hypothetical protein